MTNIEADIAEGALLAAFRGQVPPAPDWFLTAVGTPYETRHVDVNGASIAYQASGKAGAPGLVFVHGNAAHAHWWDFITPFFAKHFSIASMTFSGMGDSGWRPTYALPVFCEEQIAVAEHAGLFAHAQKPIIIAHSFGGFISSLTAAAHGDRFGGVMILDSPMMPPGEERQRPSGAGRPHRVYKTLEDALARFRLAPPQDCASLYAVDYIARWSLKRAEAGWTWKFDPSLWAEFKFEGDPSEHVRSRQCPVAFIRGEQSSLVDDRIWAYMQTLLGPDGLAISVPDAQHHLLLDQPLATVAAIRAVLAAWGRQTG